MFSATIDQIRLRRATNLPVEFQNVSSSGLQSEIQVWLNVGLFCSLTCKFLSALNDRSSDVQETDRKARRRTLGRPQPGGCRNSDDGCPRTASMASNRSYSSLVPGCRNAKTTVIVMSCASAAAATIARTRTQNLRFAQL